MKVYLQLSIAFIIINPFWICAQDIIKIKERQNQVIKELDLFNSYQYSNFNHRGMGTITFLDSIYFNEQAKIKLKSLLITPYSEKEIHDITESYLQLKIENDIKFLENSLNDTVPYKFSKKETIAFTKKLDTLKQFKYNDLYKVKSFQSQIESIKQALRNRKVFNELIYATAITGDKSFIPILLEATKDSLHYEIEVVKLALARFGIAPFLDEMLNRNLVEIKFFKLNNIKILEYKQKIGSRLIYISTQKSINEYSKFLKYPYKKPMEADDYSIFSIPSLVILDLESIILNKEFKEYLSKIELPNQVEKHHVSWVKNWMKNNYGKYKLNKNYFPNLK